MRGALPSQRSRFAVRAGIPCSRMAAGCRWALHWLGNHRPPPQPEPWVPDALRVPLPPRLRPGRRLHHPHRTGRPGGECRGDPRAWHGIATRRGAAVAVFPELALSGYSIDDLLLQDALLDAVETAAATLLDASAAHCGRCWWSARRCATPGGSTTPALVIHRGRLLGVVPKSYLPNYREFYETAPVRLRRWRRGRRASASPGRRRPSAPTLLFAAEDVPGLVLHTEICEDFWVPIPPSGRGGAGRRDGAAEPLGQQRSPSARPRRGGCSASRRSARCLAAYVYAAAGAGESTTDLAWDGQASIFENGALLAETERFPRGDADRDRRCRPRPAAAGAHAAGHLRRQPPQPPRPRPASARIAFRLDPPDGDLGFERPIERFPFVPADPAAARPGLLRGLQHPGRRPDPAAGARRGSSGRDRRLRRPRFDPGADRRGQGDRPAGPAAHRHPRLHPAGLRHQRTTPRAMRTG